MESKLLQLNERYKYEIAFVLAAFLLVFNATSLYGPGITPDSVNMLAAADGLVKGTGFVMYDGSLFTWWPPLLPTLLAGIKAVGLDVIASARILNAMLYSVLMVLSMIFFKRFFSTKFLYLLANAGMLLSVQLFIRFTVLGTEPLFLIFIFLTLIYLRKSHDDDSLSSLIPAAIFTALASLTRYPGVVLIFTGCLAVAIFPLKMGMIQRIKRIFIYGVIASLPLALWLLRNLTKAGMLTGERLPAQRGFWENLSLALDVISSWILPPQIPVVLRILFIIVLGIGLCYVLIRSFSETPYYERTRNSFITFTFFGLFYTDFIIVTSSIILYTVIDDRFLAPSFPFFLLILFIAIDKVASGEIFKVAEKKVVKYAIYTICALWLLYPAARVVKYSNIFIKEGIIDYSTTQWQKSELIARIKQFPIEGKVFSNIPDVLYLNFREYYFMVPSRHESINLLDGSNYPGEDVYLVWSDIKQRNYLYSLDEILDSYNYVLEAEFDDGKVYRYMNNRHFLDNSEAETGQR